MEEGLVLHHEFRPRCCPCISFRRSALSTCEQNVIICRKYYTALSDFYDHHYFYFIHFPLLVFAVELYPPKKQESIIIIIIFAVAGITMIISIFTLLVFAVRYIHLWKTEKKTKERGREGGQGRKERWGGVGGEREGRRFTRERKCVCVCVCTFCM
jgi:hypothetical protein